jgi:hypothetical protein
MANVTVKVRALTSLSGVVSLVTLRRRCLRLRSLRLMQVRERLLWCRLLDHVPDHRSGSLRRSIRVAPCEIGSNCVVLS